MGDTYLPNRAGDAQRKLDRLQAQSTRLSSKVERLTRALAHVRAEWDATLEQRDDLIAENARIESLVVSIKCPECGRTGVYLETPGEGATVRVLSRHFRPRVKERAYRSCSAAGRTLREALRLAPRPPTRNEVFDDADDR